MPVDLKETRLPGVGVKYGFRIGQGGRLSVILHMDGQREIYYYRRATDDEPTAVIELHDDEARQLGAILGGAYERPKIVEELELALGELQIEWIPVPDSSPGIGMTLADARLRARTGVTIIAILRDPEPVSGAQPEDTIQRGDTLVAVGKAGQFGHFRRLLAEGPFDGD
jgi:TrkA domain protein